MKTFQRGSFRGTGLQMEVAKIGIKFRYAIFDTEGRNY
jgi:hypothetical protein